MTSQPHPTLKGHYIKPDIVYHEIDFAKNTLQKLDRIKRLSELCTHVATPWYWYNSSDPSNLVLETDTLESSQYHVHPVDLRTLVPSRSPSRSFRNIDTTLPTIIISECCLCYLNPAAADTVALYFTKHLFPDSTPVGLILYEPINPNDRFGQVMVSNLAARGIVLQTLRKYGSLEAQAARMKSYGLDRIGGADVNTLWEKGVEEKEKGRVASLEMVDEVEEWKLLAGHYCVVWGWRGDQLWDGWKDVAAQMDDER